MEQNFYRGGVALTPHELFPNILSFQIIAIAAAFIVALGAVFTVLIFYIRWKQRYRDRRIREIKKDWKDRFSAVLRKDDVEYPGVAGDEEVEVLMEVWNEFYTEADEEGRENLISAAREISMPGFARQMVNESVAHRKILGITTAGRLHETELAAELESHVDSNNPLIALSAVRALVDLGVDPEHWIRRIPNARHWPNAQVKQILKEANRESITKPLISIVQDHPENQQPRFIHLLAEAKPAQARPVLKDLLDSSDEPEIIAACLEALRSFANPEDRSLALSYLDHDVPYLRLKAIRLLGRIGLMPSDVEHLQKLLGDSNWWVRYRTAEALVESSVISHRELKETRNNHPDPYARDILEQELNRVAES